MAKEHHLIYVPGLRDTGTLNKPFHYLTELSWKLQGFYPHLYRPHWEDGVSFIPKLEGLTDLIDDLADAGHTISTVGQSAGCPAVLNAFSLRKKVINGVVSATGRLREGVNVSPTLDEAAKISDAFKEAVLMFEREREKTLTAEDRRRIMTIRPHFDLTVPASTVPLEGAINITAPMIGHSTGGGFITIFYAKRFLDFLRELEKN